MLTLKTSKKVIWDPPQFFDLSKSNDIKDLTKLHRQGKTQHIVDDYQEQLRELFGVIHPSLVYQSNFEESFKTYLADLNKQKTSIKQGLWVYFPWNCSLVHILSEKDYFTVRTARNANLITPIEQKKYYNCKVGIAGLSVGNAIALAIVLQGGAKYIKLADIDVLALSNTNRIKTGVNNLGKSKVQLTAEQIYELNPYAKIELFPEGLTEKNCERFFSGLDVVIDEIDTLAMKYLMRQQAKKNRIPLVTAADSADGGVIDVERYDKNPKTKFFHGRLGDITINNLQNLNKFETGRLITKWVGPENIGPRMENSLLAMGKTIVSWPQLGGAALLNGSVVAYCVRKIANNQPLIQNRAIVSLDAVLDPTFFNKNQKISRQKSTASFKKYLSYN